MKIEQLEEWKHTLKRLVRETEPWNFGVAADLMKCLAQVDVDLRMAMAREARDKKIRIGGAV